MRVLHGELVAMQEWVKATGAKICIVFEGRDTAGKGGTIKRITERVSPRVFRITALAAPTEREKSQMYIQRYLPHSPPSEVVIFDRSCTTGRRTVMGFCTPPIPRPSLCPRSRRPWPRRILLLKWLEVSADERPGAESRINDRRSVLDLDLKSTAAGMTTRPATRCSLRLTPGQPVRRTLNKNEAASTSATVQPGPRRRPPTGYHAAQMERKELQRTFRCGNLTSL
jgi:hypothetical protein